MKNSFKLRVYELVKKIPKGKVMTYGQITQKLGRSKASRAVGNILHQNTSLKVPCHRVVNQKGRVARSYKFGGWKCQKERLLKEGVKFKNESCVEFDRGSKD